jgi:hypothetical protein
LCSARRRLLDNADAYIGALPHKVFVDGNAV